MAEWTEIKNGCEFPEFEASVLVIAEIRLDATILRRQLVSCYWESKLWNGMMSRDERVIYWKPLDWPSRLTTGEGEGR